MIRFDNVSKHYRTNNGYRVVLDRANFDFELGHNYGILGANGAGKSTLLRLIAGAEPPTSGRISRRVRVSFPLGFTGTFNGLLTARQNATFIARIFGESVSRVNEFVADFTELGPYYDMPLQTYSSGMMAKFALGLSFAIDFDVYLVDEVTEVGDTRFRAKCAAIFKERMVRSDIIMVSHNSHTIRAYCDRGAVIHNGRIELFDNLDDAMRSYRHALGSIDA